MSFFYNFGIRLSTIFQKKIKSSRIFILISKIMLYFEKDYSHSYFRNIYPSNNFLKFLKKSEILNNQIFHPLIFILVFFIFLGISTVPLSFDLKLTLILVFISFIFGSLILPKFFFKSKNNFIKINHENFYSIGFICIIIGIIFFFICAISMGGLPVFNPSLRYKLIPIFTMPIGLLIPGVGLVGSSYLHRFKNNELTLYQVRFRFLSLVIMASFFLFMLGYRTHLCAVILMMFIMGYYGKIFAIWEVIAGIFISFFLILGFGYYRSIEENAANVGLFDSLKNRVNFTVNVLNLLDSVSGDFGITKGRLILSAVPGSNGLSTRMIIGKLIAWRSSVSITPTLIGPMLVDFGKLGVTFGMTFIGFVLGLGYKIMKITMDSSYIFIYSLLLTYSIICIETGLMEINVILYFLLGFLLYMINITKNNKLKV